MPRIMTRLPRLTVGGNERLKAHLRELVEPKIAEHHGRIVKNTGVPAEFPSVVDAGMRIIVATFTGLVALAAFSSPRGAGYDKSGGTTPCTSEIN
jgi:class 3 adenylate cyclase